MPKDFVYLRDVDPTIQQDMRYAGSKNFTGRPVPGYDAPECVLVRQAAEALRGADFRARTALLKRVGALLRKLIDAGVMHGDLHFGNILVRGDRLCLTDMHDVRIVRGPLRGRRAFALAASLLGSLNWTVSTAEGARLIRAAGFRRHDEWREIHEALRADRMRYVRSRARHSLRGGAGYVRATADGCRVTLRRIRPAWPSWPCSPSWASGAAWRCASAKAFRCRAGSAEVRPARWRPWWQPTPRSARTHRRKPSSAALSKASDWAPDPRMRTTSHPRSAAAWCWCAGPARQTSCGCRSPTG